MKILCRNLRFEYKTLGGVQGVCDLTIRQYEAGVDSTAFPELRNGGCLIHIIEPPDNKGISVTNGMNYILKKANEKFGLALRQKPAVIVESNPHTRFERVHIKDWLSETPGLISWSNMSSELVPEVLGQSTPLKAKLTYFKPNGTFYSSSELVVNGDHPLFQIKTQVQSLQDLKTLPGLAAGHDDYIVHVEVPGHANDHPMLITL